MALTDIEIIEKLLPIEKRIRAKNDFSREDVQLSLNAIWGKGFSPDRKKQILKEMITRTGVKKIGIKTLYTPRAGLIEGDKTMDFLSDLMSYQGVKERY
jgi:hypothetical protein